jgi:hypothetical protein
MLNRFMDGVGLSQVAPLLVALANLKHEPNWSSLLMVALAKDKVRLQHTQVRHSTGDVNDPSFSVVSFGDENRGNAGAGADPRGLQHAGR